MMPIFWLVIVAVMLIIEIITMGLTTIWFSLGAAVAAIAAYAGAPLWLQIVLFSVVSVVVMLLARPFAMKVMDRNRTKTNIDDMIGNTATVIEPIDNKKEQGKVRYRGVEWMARSVDENQISEEETVTIEAVSGVKLLVRAVRTEMEERQ